MFLSSVSRVFSDKLYVSHCVRLSLFIWNHYSVLFALCSSNESNEIHEFSIRLAFGNKCTFQMQREDTKLH